MLEYFRLLRTPSLRTEDLVVDGGFELLPLDALLALEAICRR